MFLLFGFAYASVAVVVVDCDFFFFKSMWNGTNTKKDELRVRRQTFFFFFTFQSSKLQTTATKFTEKLIVIENTHGHCSRTHPHTQKGFFRSKTLWLPWLDERFEIKAIFGWVKRQKVWEVEGANGKSSCDPIIRVGRLDASFREAL